MIWLEGSAVRLYVLMNSLTYKEMGLRCYFQEQMVETNVAFQEFMLLNWKLRYRAVTSETPLRLLIENGTSFGRISSCPKGPLLLVHSISEIQSFQLHFQSGLDPLSVEW